MKNEIFIVPEFVFLISSLDPIRKYEGETVILELPGDTTVFNIDWISIFDLETNQNFGSSLIQNGLNVPPSLVKIQVIARHKQFYCSMETNDLIDSLIAF